MTIDDLYEQIKNQGVTREGNTLSAGGHLYLGSLTTLPEGVTLSAGGYLDLGSLTTLPEGVTLSAGGSLYLGSLTTLPEGVTLSATQVLGSLRQEWRGQSLRPIDGIVMTMVGDEHRVGAANVRTARYFGCAEGAAVYVAEVAGHTAHGETAREAIEDATAKAGPANVEQVVAAIKSSGAITRAQYRALTGACREGVRQWCRSHGVGDDVEAMPIADVLRNTSGYYGGERLAALLREVATA